LSEHVYDQSNDSGKPIFILPFSAVSQPSLASLLKKYHTFLLSNSDVDLHSLSYTLQQKRSIFANRTSVMGSSHTELIEQIQKEMHTTEGSHSTDTSLPQYATSGRILGIFTGQGAQWPTMGRELILKSKLFSSTIDRLDNCLKQAPDPPSWSLRRELLADREASRCHQASFSQPMCTAVQIALVDLLNSIGVSFSVVVGHSSGEIAAVSVIVIA
jgi:acyl transferase domain-containing protein